MGHVALQHDRHGPLDHVMCLPFAPDAAKPDLQHWSPISQCETCCSYLSLPIRLFAGRCAGPPVAAAHMALAVLMQFQFRHIFCRFDVTKHSLKPASSGIREG